jgi:predicted transcriptional regulator
MFEPTIRDKVLKAVEELPADVTYDEIMERLYIMYKVERGQQEIEAGEGIPHDEAKSQMRKWHE